MPGEDEPLHAYVTANNPENVKKAVEKVILYCHFTLNEKYKPTFRWTIEPLINKSYIYYVIVLLKTAFSDK